MRGLSNCRVLQRACGVPGCFIVARTLSDRPFFWAHRASVCLLLGMLPAARQGCLSEADAQPSRWCEIQSPRRGGFVP
jgi:hypothetical protein